MEEPRRAARSSTAQTDPAPDAPGNRAAAALRFAISVLVAGGVTWLLLSLLPRQLSVATDIVGYPTHSNFNHQRYVWQYYSSVLFAPALAALVYHLIGLRWPRSRWPDPSPAAAREEAGTSRWGLVLSQAARGAAVGATLGLGWTVVRAGAAFWRDLATVTITFVLLLSAVAAVLARGSVERFARWAARLNTLAIPFSLASLYAASRSTKVTLATDGSVYAYPWLPGWVATAATAILFVAALDRCLRARDLAAVRRVEARALLLVVVPIVLFLFTAWLPAALADFDTFHHGEYLAAAWLFREGAFPWRDSIFIHGILQDVFIPLAGFKLFGDTAWGGFSGFTMLAGPAWWITLFFLLGYLFRGRFALLLPALAVPLLRTYEAPHWRFALLPPILLALGALLERATWPRAFLLAAALVAGNVLVPELAYAAPACAVALLGFELTRYDHAQTFLANLPRTVRATVAGTALAALWGAYLVRHGAAGAFLHYYATFAPGHALSGAIPHSRGASFFFFMFLPPLLLLLVFWYCVAAARSRRNLDVRDWVVVACAVVALLYYQKFLSRPDWHILQSVSPAVPLFFYAIYKLPAVFGLSGRPAMAVSACILGAVAVWFAPAGVRANLERVPTNFIRVVPGQPVAAELGWSEPALAKAAAGWNEVRRFVDSTLDTGDSLFDFSNEPALYHYLLRRRPSTRYYHVSMAYRRAIQLDLIEELDRARPKLVAFDSDFGLPGWDRIPNEVRHYEISRYILRGYRPFARVAGRTFYLRKDIGPGARAGVTSPVELLEPPAAYSLSRPCDWGHMPLFLEPAWLTPDSRIDRRGATVTRRLDMFGWAADVSTLRPAREVLVLGKGKLLARAVPARERGDVAVALGAPDLALSGFSLFREWLDPLEFGSDDLAVYGVSLDEKASRLSPPSPLAADERGDLRLDGATPIHLVPGAVRGSVDGNDIHSQIVAALELPEQLRPSDVGGLAIEVEASRNGKIELSSRPFSPGDPAAAGTDRPPEDISFRVGKGYRTHDVIVDNCPQWYGVDHRPLYLRYPEGIVVRDVRALLRADARKQGAIEAPQDRAGANALGPR